MIILRKRRDAGDLLRGRAIFDPPWELKRKRIHVNILKLKDESVLFGDKNGKFLLPVLWVQGTENDTAHGVMPPEEEPVGEG